MVLSAGLNLTDITAGVLLKYDLPFEGRCFIIRGDFRQVLFTVKSSRKQQINETINIYPLWEHVKYYSFT